MAEIHEISPEAWTPEYALKYMLERKDQIEDMAVVWKSKDRCLNVVTSRMRPETLALLSKRLDMHIERSLYMPDKDA